MTLVLLALSIVLVAVPASAGTVVVAGDPPVDPMKPGVKLGGGGSEVVVRHRGRRGQRRGVYRAAAS